MVNGKQIRAARGLLNWSAADLAEKVGLTRQAINNIEDEVTRPREGTMNDIVRVFAEQRLEFIDNQGVRFRPEDVEVLNGKIGLQRFFDLVFFFAQTSSGTIRQSGIPEDFFDKCDPSSTNKHRKRMEPLVKSRQDIFVRALLEEGDSNFICTEYADYKWTPRESPPSVPYYIFGDSVAIFAFEADPTPKIILITSPTIANAYSKQFDRSWELAKRPEK